MTKAEKEKAKKQKERLEAMAKAGLIVPGLDGAVPSSKPREERPKPAKTEAAPEPTTDEAAPITTTTTASVEVAETPTAAEDSWESGTITHFHLNLGLIWP